MDRDGNEMPKRVENGEDRLDLMETEFTGEEIERLGDRHDRRGGWSH